MPQLSMAYEIIDSSGTDDDLTPSHHIKVSRGSHVAGNGRSFTGSVPYPRTHTDMQSQIHRLEQEAYGSVLRAFKAQSDALTWEKEGLITELRKELRVSDDEHRELLTKVNADDIICRIREWREAGGNHGSILNTPQPVHNSLSSPTVSGSRKKQKTAQGVPLDFGMQSQSFHTTTQLASPPAKWGPALVGGGKKPRPFSGTGPTPRGQFSNYGSSGTVLANEHTEGAAHDPLIGRKVLTRWPEDNSFYEAVIIDYNPLEGRHALVYDRNTPNETWEWVDLKEIPPGDIRVEGEYPQVLHRDEHSGQGHVVNDTRNNGIVPSIGRERLLKDQYEKERAPSLNGNGKILDDIEIRHTGTLIKEVENVFCSTHPDLLEIEKAKKMLKEHEQALIDVIAKLADACDSESDGDQPSLHGQLNGERGWKNIECNRNPHHGHGPNFETG